MVQLILRSYTVYTIAVCTCQYLNKNLGSYSRLKIVCSQRELLGRAQPVIPPNLNVYEHNSLGSPGKKRIEWIALAVAVNLVGSRVLSDSEPVRSKVSDTVLTTRPVC